MESSSPPGVSVGFQHELFIGGSHRSGRNPQSRNPFCVGTRPRAGGHWGTGAERVVSYLGGDCTLAAHSRRRLFLVAAFTATQSRNLKGDWRSATRCSTLALVPAAST